MTPAETALLPCPFCENGAYLEDVEKGENPVVRCLVCDAWLGAYNAVEQWNRRASPQPPEPSAERVREEKGIHDTISGYSEADVGYCLEYPDRKSVV